MPSITIGRTQKRINSTSRVFYAGGTTLNCKLKEPCSMQTPVFEVQGLTKGTLYNFCKFEDNYYWIDDVVYVTNNIQEVHCHLDPLATFRDDIKDTKGMVIYGSSDNWDKFVDDGRVQPEIFSKSQAGIPDSDDDGMFGLDTGGCVVMTFTQTSSVSFLDPDQTAVTDCGIHVALLSVANFRDCIADLNNFNITGGIIEIAQAFGRAFAGGSLLDNILRVVWLPFDYNDVVAKCCDYNQDYRYGLMLGGVLNDHTPWYELPAAAMYTHTGTITIDWNNLTDGLTFLRHNRWISLQVNNAGGFMSVPIDRFTNASDTLYYKTAFCLADGSWSFKLSSSSNYRDTLVSNSGNCSVNLMGTVYMGPTTSNQISDSLAMFEAAAVAIGAGSVIGGALGGEAGGLGANLKTAKGAYDAGIVSASSVAHASIGTELTAKQLGTIAVGTGIMGKIPVNSSSARCSTGNFNGGASGIFLNGTTPGQLYFYAQCWKPLFLHQDPTQYEQFCNEYGYPVNRYMRIGDNSGFVMCASANVSAIYGASEANKATINNFLNNGIYIEE